MHQENQEVLELRAPKALLELQVYQELWDHEGNLVQRVLLEQKVPLVKTVFLATGVIRVTLVRRVCQDLGDLQELRGPLD